MGGLDRFQAIYFTEGSACNGFSLYIPNNERMDLPFGPQYRALAKILPGLILIIYGLSGIFLPILHMLG